MATMQEVHVTVRSAQKGGRKKMIAARFRRKSPDLGPSWVAFSEGNGMIRLHARPLFSPDKGRKIQEER